MKRKFRIIGITIFMLLATFMSIEFYSSYSRVYEVDHVIFWRGYDGLYRSNDGGLTYSVHSFKSKSGAIINGCRFVICHQCIVYLSDVDNDICVITPSGKNKWINLNVVTSNWKNAYISQLSPSGNDVICNISTPQYALGGAASRPVGAVLLHTASGKASVITNVIMAKGDAYNNIIYAVVPNMSVVVRLGGKVLCHPLHIDENLLFDGMDNCVCAYSEGMIHLITPKGNYSWKPFLVPLDSSRVREIIVKADRKQVWICVSRTFSRGNYIDAYTFDGKLLGKRLDPSASYVGVHSPVIDTIDPQASLLEAVTFS